MRLPTYEELRRVEEQLDVLEYPLDQSLFVVGPPGSGKTVLALQRAQMAAELNTPINIVTYNRMLRRLLALMKTVDGVEPHTMQSFVWRDYEERTGQKPPRSPYDRYVYLWPQMLECLEQDQGRFNKPSLVVDEGQDLPKGFFTYAARHVSQKMTVFADENQALGNRRTTLGQIKAAAGLDDPIILAKNHRNTPEIARLAEYFHGGHLPAAAVRRPATGELPRLVHSQGTVFTAGLISNWYKTRGGSVGVIVDNNETGDDLNRELAERLPDTRIDFYKNNLQNEDDIDVLTDGVTILNKESVKGQEFDAVFILELELFIPCSNDTERRAMYMMCARARDNLFLVHQGNLSREAIRSLPGEDILEQS